MKKFQEIKNEINDIMVDLMGERERLEMCDPDELFTTYKSLVLLTKSTDVCRTLRMVKKSGQWSPEQSEWFDTAWDEFDKFSDSINVGA